MDSSLTRLAWSLHESGLYVHMHLVAFLACMMNPHSWEAHIVLAHAYWELGHLSHALHAAKAAYRLRPELATVPESEVVFATLVPLLLESSQLRDAFDVLQTWGSQRPGSAQYLHFRREYFARVG
jgi:hypothetical protein